MKNFVIGVKPGVGPVLKIMKDDADDPFTTPNTNYGKFQFNSEIQKLGYVDDIFIVESDFVSYPSTGGTTTTPKQYFFPAGSTWDTAHGSVWSWRASGNDFQRWHFFKEFFGRDYFPLVEVRPRIGMAFPGPGAETSTSTVTNRGYSSSFAGYNGYSYGNLQSIPVGDPGEHVREGVPVGPNSVVSVFSIPFKGDPIPDNSGAAISGQEVIRISGADGGMCRIALPGYTVTNADPENYILHEDKIPAKVVACGEVTVLAGDTAFIASPLALTPATYMDFLVKKTTDTDFWYPPYFVGRSTTQDLSFTYSVDAGGVTITSTTTNDIVIRYAVFADSDESYSTGGSKVLLKDNDGTQDYVQVKRPGSSDTAPSLNDIMIDTRLSYLPILAEGFLAYPDDFPDATPGASASTRYMGNRRATVNFDNPDGLLPMVKAGIVFEGSGVMQEAWFNNDGRDPVSIWGRHEVRISGDPTTNNKASGASVWAHIHEDSCDFYAAGENPEWLNGSFYRPYPSDMLGVRYYIFGIPSGL